VYQRRQTTHTNNTVFGDALCYTAQLSHEEVFYEKFVAQGKHKKVAITACMRKMMTILNKMVRNDQEWQMNHSRLYTVNLPIHHCPMGIALACFWFSLSYIGLKLEFDI
jgi:hypothetical protein